MVPLPYSRPSKSAEVPKPEKLEEVKITDLLVPPKQPSLKPSAKPLAKTLKPAPKKAVSVPRQIATPAIKTPNPRPNQIPKQTAELTTNRSLPLEPTADTEPTASPSSTSQAEQQEFHELFGQVEGEVDEKLIDPQVFKEPESFYTEASLKTGDKPERKLGIDRINWISLKRPDEVFTNLEPQLKDMGVATTTQGEYGGGIVYEVKKGNFIRYINLVPVKGSVGTLIVVWNRDPML